MDKILDSYQASILLFFFASHTCWLGSGPGQSLTDLLHGPRGEGESPVERGQPGDAGGGLGGRRAVHVPGGQVELDCPTNITSVNSVMGCSKPFFFHYNAMLMT